MTKQILAAALALATLATTTSAFAADWHRARRNTYVTPPPVYAPQPTYQPSDWRPQTYRPADDYRPAPRPRPTYGY